MWKAAADGRGADGQHVRQLPLLRMSVPKTLVALVRFLRAPVRAELHANAGCVSAARPDPVP